MKLTEILPGVFVVEVPVSAQDIQIANEENLCDIEYSFDNPEYEEGESSIDDEITSDSILIEDMGNFELLGTCTKDEISFDVSGLVEKTEALTKDGFSLYEDYTEYTLGFDSPEESFRSLLLSKGIKEFEKLVVIKKIK